MEVNQDASRFLPVLPFNRPMIFVQAHVSCHSNPLLQVCTNRGISLYSVQSCLTFSHHTIVLPLNYVIAIRKHSAVNLIVHYFFKQ